MERKDKEGKLTEQAHCGDHDFVWELKEKIKKREELKDKVVTSVLIAFVWSMISGIGAILWYAFTERIDK